MDLEEAEIEAFVTEVADRLQQYDDALLDFEGHSDDKELLNKIFRVAHTIKGNAGFVGLDNMVDLSHAVESLFAQLRDDLIRLEPGMAGLLLEAGDVLRKILAAFAENDPAATEIPVDALAGRIAAFLAGGESQQKAQAASQAAGEEADETASKETLFRIQIQLKSGTALPGARAYLLRRKIDEFGEIKSESPEVEQYDAADFTGALEFILLTAATQSDLEAGVRSLEIETISIEPAAADSTPAELSADDTVSETLFDVSDATGDSDTSKVAGNPNGASRDGGGASSSMRESLDALRVPVRKIDDLLNLVGELLSANSHYMALASEFRAKHGNRGLFVNFRENSEQLGRISAELQEKVMKVRMIPVGTVFSRFRRLVRDFNANHPEKSVTLNVRGEDTEVDKTQIDMIYDPLLHLVRNSIDHGIESREDRIAAGKSDTGIVSLNSYQAGNHIYIEVEDDGKGLDVERIRNRAIERELIPEAEALKLNDSEVFELIFQPGFSTAEKVTDLSGRGVGMDVVRRNIESINGQVEIQSTQGKGSRFRIQLPLSLAIVTALKVLIHDRLYAIPINAILETIKVDEQLGIREIEHREVVEVREEHVSLVRLAREIGLSEMPTQSADEYSAGMVAAALRPARRVQSRSSKKPVVIVQYRGDRVGLLVDDLIGYEDMVIKSLARNYEEIEGLAGAAILGRGEICLILDAQRLIDSFIGNGGSLVADRAANGKNGDRKNTDATAPSPGPDSGTPASAPSVAQSVAPPAPENKAAVASTPTASAAPTSQPAPGSRTKPAEQEPQRSAAFTMAKADLSIIKAMIREGRAAAIQAVRSVAQSATIDIQFSETRIQSLSRLRAGLTRAFPESGAHAFYVSLAQELQGNMLLLIDERNLVQLAGMMYDPDRFQTAGPETISAIREVTNLMAVSFTNAMSKIAGARILPSAPVHVPEYAQVFDHGLLKHADESHPTLVIETEFKLDGENTLFYFYIMPGSDGFQKLIQLHRKSAGGRQS
ncbi:MAG: chemotaxis protein CheW [bacterium]|nr:chemotaxis protein CheW [bacterium]